MKNVIGITTTIPVEILFAAGKTPVDLNNLFIADENPGARITEAEHAGLPVNVCAWIKGLFGIIRKHNIREVIGVVEGDCSDTGALIELLREEGIIVHTFGYPHRREPATLLAEMERLASALGTTLARAAEVKIRLDQIRSLVAGFDTKAKSGVISGEALFQSLLACCDFYGDPDLCENRIQTQIQNACATPLLNGIAVGCIGVPTILNDLWTVLEGYGLRATYHEVPKEFARLSGISQSLIDSYLDYTYPYQLSRRVTRIAEEIKARELKGIIHYVQSFCHRQLHDRILREHLNIPILTVEGDRPGPVDGRTRLRLEAFAEQLRERV